MSAISVVLGKLRRVVAGMGLAWGESSALWLFLQFGRWECEDGGDNDAFNIFALQKLHA